MSAKLIREHIYMYSAEAQYYDLEPEIRTGLQVLEDIKPLQICDINEHTTCVKWLVEFLKELFAHNLQAHVMGSVRLAWEVPCWPHTKLFALAVALT